LKKGLVFSDQFPDSGANGTTQKHAEYKHQEQNQKQWDGETKAKEPHIGLSQIEKDERDRDDHNKYDDGSADPASLSHRLWLAIGDHEDTLRHMCALSGGVLQHTSKVPTEINPKMAASDA
jgi:hypothetical protein